jgi:hypothetical protein
VSSILKFQKVVGVVNVREASRCQIAGRTAQTKSTGSEEKDQLSRINIIRPESSVYDLAKYLFPAGDDG